MQCYVGSGRARLEPASLRKLGTNNPQIAVARNTKAAYHVHFRPITILVFSPSRAQRLCA